MSAVALLAEGRAAGISFRIEGGHVRLSASEQPSPELLARLRLAKSELTELLSADRCRYCGQRIDWREPGARAFADGMGAHDACWHEAEIDRLLVAGARAVRLSLADGPTRGSRSG